MLGLAFKYSYLNAKVRTIYSQRLKEPDWRVLSRCPDVPALIQYLKTTYYGNWTGYITDRFERQIYSALFNDYLKISRNLKPGPRKFLLSMLSRFEAENIKILLRAKKSNLPVKTVEHLLYPVETFSTIDWEKIWHIQDVKDAVKSLLKTCFGPALTHALPQFEAQGRLFPIEMAIEIQSYRCILENLSAIPCRRDKQMARTLIGALVDSKNVYHAARLRFLYGLSTEESLNYTYPGGAILNLKGLHAICRATNLRDFINSLPISMRKDILTTEDLLTLKINTEQWLIKRLKRAFLGLPFHIGVEIAWLLYRELEIEAIIRLLETKGKRHSMMMEKFIPKALLREE